MHTISDTYFNDPKIDPMNRLLLTFAAYNAGPPALRRSVSRRPPGGWILINGSGTSNYWFLKSVGQVTVQYVSNIYKYYVAYKLVYCSKANPS